MAENTAATGMVPPAASVRQAMASVATIISVNTVSAAGSWRAASVMSSPPRRYADNVAEDTGSISPGVASGP